MKANDIRQSFIDYFAARGHAVVPSSPVIPQDDPTILFANAGMNQFKRIFQGLDKAKFPRAVSSQKCLRAGGKHNDLENVGFTARHHTFFEMLGNFSFGDYFKEDAIKFAWEYITSVLGLPTERLYATVYTDDDDAAALWAKFAPELKNGRILRFGKKDNYWAMGDTGPNGPCSEIHIDRGIQYSCGKPTCTVNCDCDRFMEIWNLVFMQYNTDDQGRTTALPKPSIDTGAGLERIAAVLQKAETNYDTDLFAPLIDMISLISGHRYEAGAAGVSHRVVADHIRALAFCIADGAALSNEGRGYVLRRILRRAARHGRELGMHEPFLAKLLPPLAETMGHAYPQLIAKQNHIANVLTAEEEQFGRTLDVGIELFEGLAREAEATGSRVIPGAAVFKLYDTYGFPVDLTAVMARERGLGVDETGFEDAMSEQRERSRAGGDFAARQSLFAGISARHPNRRTEFLYNTYEIDAALVDYAPVEGAVILDRTPFYVQSGGQISDVGQIVTGDFLFAVNDVVREGALILHLGKPKTNSSPSSDRVQAQVAKERRRAIERNHTATHLLHAALRSVLGDHVHQAGSLVAPDRLRFDFTHHSAPTQEELDRIETIVNARVLDNIPLEFDFSDFDSAKTRGAMALFGEKYGDVVRVVTVPGFSIELCGGCHVRATGDIGMFRIVSEGAIAAGVRRIEAVTGEGARQWFRQREQVLDAVAGLLKGETEQIPNRVERLLERQRQLEKRIQELEANSAKHTLDRGAGESEQVNGHSLVVNIGPEWQRDRVMALADELKKKNEDTVALFASRDPERGTVTVFLAVSRGALDKGFNAGQALGAIIKPFGGRGGGKPNLGQGGFDASGMNDSELGRKLHETARAVLAGSNP
jgi:alanyl-tRNA synthetase